MQFRMVHNNFNVRDLDKSLKFYAEAFLKNVMGQHYIVTYGDNRPKLRDFCAITGIRYME